MPAKRGVTKRVTHIIKPNSRVYVPLNRVFFDCEAHRNKLKYNVEKQTLWFGYACFERARNDSPGKPVTEDWCRFETADAFWNFLEEHSRNNIRLLVYAHNLQYDAALIQASTKAAERGWEMSDYVQHNHLLWLEFRKGRSTILFVDTLNYFGTSLASLGKAIGFDKLEMPASTTESEAWNVYCKRDVEVLRAAMHSYYELLETEDLGHYQKTLASQAFGAWRHRFMKHSVMVIADDALSKLEREAYHGGRTEVFYDREIVGETYCLDINAMYPAMMSRYLYPLQKVKTGKKLSLAGLAKYLGWGSVIADVTIDTDEPCYPCNTGTRVIYPVGRFNTTLTTRELIHALYRGRVASVRRWSLYKDGLLFRDYVVTLHRLRQKYKEDGNDAFSYMCKILSNSLYGKFGQHDRRWVACSDPVIPGVYEATGECGEKLGVLRHRLRFGQWQHELVIPESFDSFPAIAAHITADARMYLWELITTAGREHVFYCDTDSVYTDTTGYHRLQTYIDSRMLGALKVEGSYQSVHFRAPKDYRLDGKKRVKGVRASAWEVRDGYYEQEQFESYDQVLGRGDDGYILVERIAKRVKRVNLQSVGENVGRRTPVHLGDVSMSPRVQVEIEAE